MDPDNEMINVSDDDDLLTAYELAESELAGSLKFLVEMKKPASASKCVKTKLPKGTKEPTETNDRPSKGKK
jgi:hypothetical protein